MSTNVYEYETSKLPSALEFYLHGHNQPPHRYLSDSGDLSVLTNENHHLMSFRSPEDISNCQINRSGDKLSPCLNLQARASDDNISVDNSILNGDSLFTLYNDAYNNSRQQQSGLDASAYNLSCYPNNDNVYCSGNPFVLAYDSFSCFPLSTSDKSEQEDFLDSRLGGANSVFESINRSSVKKRPSTSNRKERRRTHSINAAFSALRNCIPNVPSDTKLSKIKTLRLATSYIAFLMNVLDKNDPKLAEAGFKADMSTRRSENRDEKRKREAQEILKATMRMSEKPPKGRTGWPQQVWASELK